MASDTDADGEADVAQTDSDNGSSFRITVYGESHTNLSDREKEEVAEKVHRMLQEDHGVHPDSVGVDGYMED